MISDTPGRAEDGPARPRYPIQGRSPRGERGTVADPSVLGAMLPMPERANTSITFLFTDIEGSTRLWEQQPEAMGVALARHDALLRQIVAGCGGRVFKTVGDSFYVAFETPPDAVRAAITAQRAIQGTSWPGIGALRVRMAVHTGLVEQRENDYFGPPLNRVARLLGAGHGGQILLSQAAEEGVREVMLPGTCLLDLGEHRLKDLIRPERIFQVAVDDLPPEFPPLRSLEAFAHNLPIQLTSFVGREREIIEVKRLLNTTHLLTLTGPGGTGKTRLSLQVAAEELDRFANGVWLVELAPLTDSTLVLYALATVLGVREEPGHPLLETIATYLRGKQLLLILDNCEHLIAVCAQIAETLLRQCPRLHILASSREALGIAGETTWRVPSLSLPGETRPLSVEGLLGYEALRLFVDRAVAVLPTFQVTPQNAAALVQVCRQLDGIPLALELAAARVRALSIEQIAARLDDRFRLLTGGSRTALPRQQTLRALIDWSWDLLNAQEQAVWGRLAVFSGGWTLEGAEAVCGGGVVDPYDVLDLLTQLVNKSLVMMDEQDGVARYHLLETIRQYGWERLVATNEVEDVRDRHLAYYLTLGEQAEPQLVGPGQGAWLARLEAEHDNLRLALEWAPARSAEATARLAGALLVFWVVRGYWSEGHYWIDGALQRGMGLPPAYRARLCYGAGVLANRQGDFARAQAVHSEGLALYHATGDQQGQASTLGGLGWLALNEGDFALASSRYEEALAICRAIDDRISVADGLSSLAQIAQAQGQYARACGLLDESLALYRALEDRLGIATALLNSGRVAFAQGDYARSTTLYEEALILCRELDYRANIGLILSGLGLTALHQGDDARASRFCHDCLTLYEELGHKLGVAEFLAGLAGAVMERGTAPVAARLAGAAAGLWAGLGVHLWPADQMLLDQTAAAAHAVLGEAACAVAWAEGAAWSLDEALAVAHASLPTGGNQATAR